MGRAGLVHFEARSSEYKLQLAWPPGSPKAVVIDHLTPRYLAHVIREDPWHQPYKYLGERDHFTLRSVGADGKKNTADDILVNQSR